MATPLAKRLASEPVSKVEVHISCDKLMDRDLTSKSDPCCLLYVMTNGRWVEVCSVSLFRECLHISFSVYCEELQKLLGLELDATDVEEYIEMASVCGMQR